MVFCGPDGVSRSPRFFPLDRGQVTGQLIHFLKTVHGFNQAFCIFSHGLFKFVLETPADDENNLVKPRVYGVID